MKKRCDIFTLYHSSFYHHPGTPLDKILTEKTFAEPRLMIFTDHKDRKECQGIIAENIVIFRMNEFTPRKGLLFLIAMYYIYDINYPKSCPASALLLFVQELLLDSQEASLKKPAKYSQFIDSILQE